MKQIKIYSLLFSFFFILPACNDWLDVDKLGSLSEEEVYSNEDNMNAVLNGIYSDMAGSSLYGGHLALTTIEYLGHYYYYSQTEPNESGNSSDKSREYYWLGTYNYAQDDIKARFAPIWEKGYELIFGLNVFIDGVNESDAINQQKKNLLLGEAYGLRAFLHFDLFRLFGPVYKSVDEESGAVYYNETVESIPYNNQPTVATYSNLPAGTFLENVLKDIETAKELLAEDPVLTEGVNDYDDLEDKNIEINNLTTAEAFHKIFRNRRFNYYAASALEARVLLYKGDVGKAADRAREVIENTQNNKNEDLKLFGFEDRTTIVSKSNYIFYNEVIFALHNINLSTTWDSFLQSTNEGQVHVVSEVNLKNNIFPFEGDDFTYANDYRARQWKITSDFTQRMFSSKYRMNTLKNNNAIKNHQPLIRISEMYYILAEACLEDGNVTEAARQIGIVQAVRGIQSASSEYAENLSTVEALQELLEREYYKEFFAEGQVFFFHKRRNSSQIFIGYGSGSVDVVPDNYVVPLPTSETNI